jgi:hypothetical protein
MDSSRFTSMGVWVAMGIVAGTVVFAVTQHPAWIGIGVVIGAAIGAAVQLRGGV